MNGIKPGTGSGIKKEIDGGIEEGFRVLEVGIEGRRG